MKINSKFTRIMGVGLSAAMLATTVLTAVPAMALTAPVVTTNNTGISQNGSWDIRFTVATAVNGTPAGNITITFPAGFTVNQSLGANISGLTISAGPGWLSSTNFGNAVLTTPAANSTAATRQITINITAGDIIGADAQVRVILPVGTVTNPSLAGSYNITVATSNETTAVTSNNIVVTLPNIGPLPGQVEGKNSNGDVLYRNIVSDLSAVIATPGVSRIELAAGTYNATNTAGVIGQTIVGVGTAGTVILTAPAASVPLTVSVVNVTLENLTIQGNINGTADLLSITGNNTTVKNVTFIGGVNQVNATFTAASNRTTLSDCIFNVTGNVTSGVTTNGRVTTNSTFNVDNGGVGIIASNGGLTATSAVFNGATGTGAGIAISGNGSSTITTSTFNNLGNNALANSGIGSVSVSGSTFNGSGNATATSATTNGVITASGAGDLILINNTISNSAAAAYGLYVSGGNVTARFNTITNTLNAKQTSGIADAANNWWGTAAGPGSSSISGNVTTTPFLAGVTNSSSVVFSSSNLSGGTAGGLPSGVDISVANVTTGAALTANILSSAKYASNPQTTAPTGTPIAYYDVYVAGASTESGSTITIKFFAPGITPATKVSFASATTGGWVLATNQAVSADNSFVVVTVTPSSSPSTTDLGRTPFVLTNVISAPTAPTLVGPTGTGVPLNTGFSWNPVAGATSYKFQVSTSSLFDTTVAGGDQTVASTVAGGVTLASNTTYFWRVQAVNSGGVSAWTTGTFTTGVPASAITAPPPVITNNITTPAPVVNIAPAQVTVQPPNVTVNPPTVNVAAPAAPNVTVNPPQVTISPPPPQQITVQPAEVSQVIPTYILWTIILIGAVLIIALIVLIVRTRRVA